MKIHFDDVTKRVTGYTTFGEAPTGSFDAGDFEFLHDPDEYEVQGNSIVHVGPSAEKIAAALPKTVTMRQARLALLQSSLLVTVTDAINASTDEALKIEWEYATEVKRDWPSLISLSTGLGMTDTDLDNIFLLASTL